MQEKTSKLGVAGFRGFPQTTMTVAQSRPCAANLALTLEYPALNRHMRRTHEKARATLRKAEK